MNAKIHLAFVALTLFVVARTDGAAPAQHAIEPYDLRCEYLKDPLGIDAREPRLYWKLRATDPRARGQRQSAYRILAASTRAALDEDRGDLWDSGEVASDRSTHIAWAGAALRSRAEVFWKVRARDQEGKLSPWSPVARFTMGLLEPSDWTAKWIGCDRVFERKRGWPPPDNAIPDPWLRKTFEIPRRPSRAVLTIASVGYHEVYVNGKKAGDGVLVPSVANHKKRARYVTYDIAGLLRPGRNAIGLWLGVSWSIFPHYKTEDRPATPIAIAQADIELPDGERIVVATDETWKTHPSPNTLLGVWDFMHYGGELHDVRLEMPDWCDPARDDADWKTATVYSPKLILSAEMIEPNRPEAKLAPIAIEDAPGGAYRVDMGRNYAGFVEIDVEGKPGDRIDFLFSEHPDQEMTHRLRSAYIIGPSGKGTFANRFNYLSGRWITIKGLAKKPAPGAIRGALVRTDYARATKFRCSSDLLDRIYETTLWTFESLSLGGYVVDCPQRERMGYGGDAHATTETGLSNYSLGAFYTKWSEDWRDVQGEDGNLPYTAPTQWGGGGPGWSGYCITLPWDVYRRYGDVRILERNYPTMARWLAFLETKAKDDMLVRWGGEWDFLGDWLWPGAKGTNGDTRESLFFNNAYWIYNLDRAARIAEILGKTGDAARFRARADRVRRAVHAAFYDPSDASYVNGCQAYLAIALFVDLPPAGLRAAVWHRLEEEILSRSRGHIHAGITGGAFLFKLLLAAERNDLIHAMVSKTDYPGWGDILARGGTTIWEAWDGHNSLLHSSYLYVGTWFVEGLAGIKLDADGAGFQHFTIAPGVMPGDPVEWVECRHESLHGLIESDWRIDGDRLRHTVAVPPNASATLIFPTSDPASVREGRRALDRAPGVEVLRAGEGRIILRLAAGRYTFVGSR
ncbi:MAG: family 78 glycoside hydrolase catalytic domain [Planctomycetes bacterium]|nr:family 78 glycoside hydrolase catalytic domain [Planctomycetota bacterium]